MFTNNIESGSRKVPTYIYKQILNHNRSIPFGAIQKTLLCTKSIPGKKNQRTMNKSNHY